MTHEESYFTGAEGVRIYYQAWKPESARATLQLVHGFAEHGGRFQNVIDALVPAGIAVYATDHLGCGQSEGQRNYVPRFTRFVEDEDILFGIIEGEYPGLPRFMLGHSMGSCIALRWTLAHEGVLKGLIMSGSGLRIGGNVSPLLRGIARVLSVVAPRLMVDPGDLSEFLSRDPAVVTAYNTDPLVYAKKISARLGIEMTDAFAENGVLAPRLATPLLYQKGADDRLIVEGEELAKAFTTADLTVKIYPGYYHEVYNEPLPERTPVLNDLREWITARMGGR